MDEHLNKEDISSIHELSAADTMATLARGMQSSISQIEQLNNTIDVQREIISEQASKIQELNQVLSQRLHSSFKTKD